MKHITKKSTEDVKNIKNYIFREFEKKDDTFIATNRFYTSEEVEDGKFMFKTVRNDKDEKIIPYSEDGNIYVSLNNKDLYFDLILLSNISFNLDDININKSVLIHRLLENYNVIDDKLFEDLYYNEEFSKKINIELPQKYNNNKIILEDIEIKKKYLFKINLIELNRTFNQYKV